jgi:large subunit ribosomal protein L6
MSRIAKYPVNLPAGVSVVQQGSNIVVKGPKAELTAHIPANLVALQISDSAVAVSATTTSKQSRAASGLVRNTLANLVQGVSEEFTKELVYKGVGYRAVAEGRKLTLNVGYSHPVVLEAPEGISLAVQKSTIKVTGADLQAVGQFAANVRAIRVPEPYKGKGIAYADEHIRRKAGKAGKAA